MDRPTFENGVRLAARIGAEIKAAVADSATEILVADYYMTPPSLREVQQLPVLLEHADKETPAWDAVKMIAQRELWSGRPLPRRLGAWVADQLDGKRARPATQGQDRNALFMRNQRVVAAVQVLVDCGFSATRSKPIEKACREGGSACDAVGIALRQDKIHLGYKAVEKIWSACPQASRERFRDYYPAWGIRRPTQ